MQKYEYRYDDLAHTIIELAVSDYRKALKGRGVYIGKWYRSPDSIIKEVEAFFRSSYFRLLTKVNGEYLIEQLKKEHEEKERKKNARRVNTGNTQSY